MTPVNDDVESTLRCDPVMARLVDEYGPVTVEPAEHPYQRLCVSIVNQQLSTASAVAIRDRLFALFDGPVTPGALLELEPEPLRETGLSRTKVEYLCNAARAFQQQDLTPAGLADHSDEAVVETLTDIGGVGPWTARMYLIFVLGREDVLPLGDLAVRRGIEALYAGGDSLDRAEMREIADAWRPYRSYGTRYVWLADED
jgi:DNA-3-methyladenine glycosylase II